MREVEFKMERQGLVKEGQTVEITERKGVTYSYIVEPAVAMSGCFSPKDRIKSTTGVIKEIRHNPRGYYLVIDFDE